MSSDAQFPHPVDAPGEPGPSAAGTSPNDSARALGSASSGTADNSWTDVPRSADNPFAQLRGIVRTRDPHVIAGVSGGLARATGTDPLLFRILFGVLAFFGGAGVLIYIAAWLLLPLEGDDVSPAESLLGRGRSSTSPALTVALLVAGVLFGGLVLSDGPRAPLLAGAAMVGLILLLRRDGPAPVAPPTPGSVPPADPTGAPFGSTTAPTGVGDPATSPTVRMSQPVDLAKTSAPQPPGPDRRPAPPTTPNEPFTPHGPYWYDPPAGGTPAGGWHPVSPDTAAAPPVRRQRERSLLVRLTFSLGLLALGMLALLDILGASVPVPAYFAVALTVVGIGLLVGSVIGTGRRLIPIGVVLALFLFVTAAASQAAIPSRWQNGGSTTTWQPMSISEVRDSYDAGSGRTVLDLSRVDFTNTSRSINLSAAAGDVQVTLPAAVDATVHVEVGVGNAVIFGQRTGGLGIDQTIRDDGDPGGGAVTITVDSGAGNVEVTR
jgi:phage shock protein PspC (stress-responsive transcriptional regulator)